MIYDENRLIKILDALPKDLRVAFAALCAERLMPAYVAFAQSLGGVDATKLSLILGRLWQGLMGDSMSCEEVQSNLDVCMSLIQTEDQGRWSDLRSYAGDAIAAVAYSLRTQQNGHSQDAAWAARRVYEALDHFVIKKNEIDTNEPGAERTIIDDLLVQKELTQQQRDLDTLSKLAQKPGWREEIADLKAGSAARSYDFLTT